jgi:flavin reductase (DIM6/NTAB) family NADH-FMN oxidoreductase RutF
MNTETLSPRPGAPDAPAPFYPTDVLDPAQLRASLGAFATGVAVVTAATADGPVGMTVNSFTSVSLTPPLILFCTAHRSRLRPVYARATAFAVNILAEDQADLSRRFARQGRDRFAATRWRPGTNGAPVLLGAAGVLECVGERVVAAGDHDMVLGRVVTLHPESHRRPLLFHGGGYAHLQQ